MENGNIIFEFGGINFTWEGIGIAITAIYSIISFIGKIIGHLHNKHERTKNNNIEYITNKRVDWIYAVREEGANFAAKAHLLAFEDVPNKVEVEKLNVSIFRIKLYLNYCGPIDKILIELMHEIAKYVDIKGKTEQADKCIRMFCNHLRIYLKVEWDRVKAETNGENYDKERNLKELISAYKKYSKEAHKEETVCIKETIKKLEENLKQV